MCMHVGSLLEGILTFTLLDRKSTADLQKLKEAIDCYVAKESSASDVEKDELCIALFEGECSGEQVWSFLSSSVSTQF